MEKLLFWLVDQVSDVFLLKVLGAIPLFAIGLLLVAIVM